MIVYDSKWSGNVGISRFSKEIRSRLNVGSVMDIPSPLLPFGKAATEYRSSLKDYEPSLIYSPGFFPPPVKNVPFALTVHDLLHVDVPYWVNIHKSAYYHVVIRRALKKAQLIFTVSNFSRDRIINWSGVDKEKVVVISNGVGEIFSLDGDRLELDRPYLLYVGGFRPHKNIKRMLLSFSAICEPLDIKLLIVGPADGSFQRLVRRLGLEGYVDFMPDATDDDLAKAYRGAKALLFPSLYEGFGLPIVEAMACGTPVITSSLGAMKEVAGEAAILVDPLSTEEIAKAIRDVSSSCCDDWVGRGLERSKLFCWDSSAAKLSAALVELS